MGIDYDNPHKWFTAGEVADLARRVDVDGFPATKRGVNNWIRRLKTEDPDGFGKSVQRLCRPRAGQRGGGGLEYHQVLLRRAGKALTTAMEGEVKTRVAGILPPCKDGQHFYLSDERLMLEAIGLEEGHILRLNQLKPRVVRRKYIQIGEHRFFLGKTMEGQTVLVASMIQFAREVPKLAFVWRVDPIHGGLLAHGKAGFIGVVEADPPLDMKIDWEDIHGFELGAACHPGFKERF